MQTVTTIDSALYHRRLRRTGQSEQYRRPSRLLRRIETSDSSTEKKESGPRSVEIQLVTLGDEQRIGAHKNGVRPSLRNCGEATSATTTRRAVLTRAVLSRPRPKLRANRETIDPQRRHRQAIDRCRAFRRGHGRLRVEGCDTGCQHGKLLESATEENSTRNHECACLQQ